MKSFKDISSLKLNAPGEVYTSFTRDILNNHVCEGDFTESIGGAVIIIETVEDLKASNISRIMTTQEEYDYCCTTSSKNYCVVVDITNNAGGDTYYIVKDVYEQFEAIFNSMYVSTH